MYSMSISPFNAARPAQAKFGAWRPGTPHRDSSGAADFYEAAVRGLADPDGHKILRGLLEGTPDGPTSDDAKAAGIEVPHDASTEEILGRMEEAGAHWPPAQAALPRFGAADNPEPVIVTVDDVETLIPDPFVEMVRHLEHQGVSPAQLADMFKLEIDGEPTVESVADALRKNNQENRFKTILSTASIQQDPIQGNFRQELEHIQLVMARITARAREQAQDMEALLDLMHTAMGIPRKDLAPVVEQLAAPWSR